MKKKIIFFTGSMLRGGAERVISILSNQFIEEEWDTHIGMLLFNKVQYQLSPSIKTFDFSGNGTSKWMRIPFWIKRIRKYIKKEKPDVIVSFMVRINIIVLLASIGTGVKVVISERNDPFQHDLLTKILAYLLYPFANRIIFQTKKSMSFFSKKTQKKGIVIPNPISISCYASEKKKKKIVTVGRLEAQKNQAMLIKAFANIRHHYPEYELFIYGEGSLLSYLEDLSIQLNVRENVHFEGNVINIHEQIADAEFFVLSSNYEGQSNALLEAMIMGLPCISTNYIGIDEYITDKKNGIIVPIANQRELEKAMLFLLQNSNFRKMLSEEAKKISIVFSKRNVVKKWNEIIEE